MPRACICCMERSSRSSLATLSTGFGPLMNEIDVLHHASYAPATRDGQGAGSEARAWLLLDTGSLRLQTSRTAVLTCCRLRHIVLCAHFSLCAEPFFCEATSTPRPGSTLSELASVSGVGGCAIQSPRGDGGACDDKKGLPGLEGPPEACDAASERSIPPAVVGFYT